MKILIRRSSARGLYYYMKLPDPPHPDFEHFTTLLLSMSPTSYSPPSCPTSLQQFRHFPHLTFIMWVHLGDKTVCLAACDRYIKITLCDRQASSKPVSATGWYTPGASRCKSVFLLLGYSPFIFFPSFTFTDTFTPTSPFHSPHPPVLFPSPSVSPNPTPIHNFSLVKRTCQQQRGCH